MYPFQQSNQQGSFGFSDPSQRPGEGPGYPLQQGGGFPCPPSVGYPPAPSAYPSYPQAGGPPMPTSQFSNASSINEYGASSYGNVGSNMYPPQTPNSAPFNPSAMPYNANPSSGPGYPSNAAPLPNAGPSPYNPQASFSQGTPYPPTNFPQNTGAASFNSSSAAYPQNPGQLPYSSNSPYPPMPGAVPQQTPYQPGGPQGYAPKTSQTSYSSFGSAPVSHSGTPAYSAAQSYGNAGTLWPYQERATVRPAVSFDPTSDAATLRKAMKGFGTDEKAIIAVLGRRPSEQRQQILLRYQQAYGKDLIKDLKSELSGRFEMVIIALMTPFHEYLAVELNNATKGLGTKEHTLIQILCSSDNMALRAIKTVYTSKFKHPLENDLKGDLSGYLERLLVAVSTGNRDETNYDTSVAPQLAQTLYQSGVKKLGTDEAEFIRIMSCYSYPVLRCVFSEYAKLTGKSFESAIISETSGDFKNGLLALYSIVNNRAAYFAKELNSAMKGMGTMDNTLIRIIISRSEIDMGNIKDEYYKMYGKRLEDAISSETSGDYKSLLLTLIQG